MNVFVVRLTACRKKCVELFASKGSGTFLKTKSVKKNEGEVSKGAAVLCSFPLFTTDVVVVAITFVLCIVSWIAIYRFKRAGDLQEKSKDKQPKS